MYIYVASSRKNREAVQALGKVLRNIGHEVYVFCDDNEPADKLSQMLHKSPNTKRWTHRDAVINSIAQQVFGHNMGALENADCVLMMLPCGNSSHMEAGYIAGRKWHDRQKYLIAYGALVPGEWDAMYGMFDQIFAIDETEKMVEYFITLKRKEVEKNAGLVGEKQSAQAKK